MSASMNHRAKLAAFLETPAVRNGVMWVIIFNAIILGLETSPAIMNRVGGLLIALDRVCLAIFVIELVLKLYANGLRFFRLGWNVFDFIIVGIALLPASDGMSVLRALRVLRVLRLVSAAPRLRRVVEGFVKALPGMASVFVLIAIIYYIAAVMATKLFGATFPDWFGSLGASAYSLFQIMTLESWSMGIVRPVMEVYPNAWMFFVPFIMSTTFAVMNLLIGLIVSSMQEAAGIDADAKTDAYRDEVLTRLTAIEAQLNAREAEDRAERERERAQG
jgi:voltage-gated sodium channel